MPVCFEDIPGETRDFRSWYTKVLDSIFLILPFHDFTLPGGGSWYETQMENNTWYRLETFRQRRSLNSVSNAADLKAKHLANWRDLPTERVNASISFPSISGLNCALRIPVLCEKLLSNAWNAIWVEQSDCTSSRLMYWMPWYYKLKSSSFRNHFQVCRMIPTICN